MHSYFPFLLHRYLPILLHINFPVTVILKNKKVGVTGLHTGYFYLNNRFGQMCKNILHFKLNYTLLHTY